MIAIIVTYCGATEAVLILLEDDDIVMRHIEQVDDELSVNFKYVCQIPSIVRQWVSGVMCLTYMSFRSSYIRAASAQVAQIRAALRVADELPSRLARGNVRANLDNFNTEA